MIVRRSRRDVLCFAGVAAASLLPAPVLAEAWPVRPIKIICGFPAGGLADIFARAYGEYIAQRTGQPVYVENKAGAVGAIAAEQVKSAPPDGYTLMITISATMIVNKVLFKKLPYDPDRDFALIAWLNAGHLPFIVNKDVPAKNVAEFAEYAAKNKVSLGAYGAGSYPHVVAETLNRRYGLKIETVQYRGEAPMWQDVASGSIQGGSGSLAGAASVLQTGAGRPIAVPSMVRSKKLPDVPTFYEQGLTEQAFQVRGFICLVGPIGMPDDTVQKLSDLMVEAGRTERIQKILDTFGIDEGARDRAYFKEVLAKEGPVWIDLVKSLNIEPQ